MKVGIGAVIAAWLFGVFVGGMILVNGGHVGTFSVQGGFIGAEYKGVLYECIPLQPQGAKQ